MSVTQVVHTEITTNADTKGVDKYDSKLKGLEKTGEKLGKTLQYVTAAAATALSVRAILGITEDFGEMTGLLETTANKYGVSIHKMQEIAKVNADMLNEGVFSYAKLLSAATLTTDQYGGSLKDAENLATAFTASLKLSGATASETTMVMDQAAKMFASGEANSRAFLSIAVKAPVLLDKLSKKFNMNAQQLKKALEDETISMKKLYSAIGETADGLAEQVQQGPMNFSHFMSLIRNELMYFVGGIEESTELLSNIFKTTIMVLRAFTKTVNAVIKALGGWEMAFRLLIVAIVVAKKELIFMQTMKIAGWLMGVARAVYAVGVGAIFTGRAISAAKIAATAGAALGALAATFLVTELIAMAQGRPNFIGASIFYIKEAVASMGSYLSEFFSNLFDSIIGKAMAVYERISGLGRMVKGFFGFGKNKSSNSAPEAPSLIPKSVTENAAGGGSQEITNNNNQKVSIEVNGAKDPKEVAKEVQKALADSKVVPSPTYDDFVLKAAQ